MSKGNVGFTHSQALEPRDDDFKLPREVVESDTRSEVHRFWWCDSMPVFSISASTTSIKSDAAAIMQNISTVIIVQCSPLIWSMDARSFQI